jgi:hypothetical protein
MLNWSGVLLPQVGCTKTTTHVTNVYFGTDVPAICLHTFLKPQLHSPNQKSGHITRALA